MTDPGLGTIDLLPTIATLVGANLPAHPIDGLDVSKLLADPNTPSPHREVGYFYCKNGKAEAVSRGKWKLRPSNKNADLYDLEADVSESNNLAAANPEVVSELPKLAADYDADLKANSRPVRRAGK